MSGGRRGGLHLDLQNRESCAHRARRYTADRPAVLFGYPMIAPHDDAKPSENKIPWVSKTGLAMTVDAQLVGTSKIVHLGDVPVDPSHVNVPNAGCRHLTLHLSGYASQWTDTLDVVYKG